MTVGSDAESEEDSIIVSYCNHLSEQELYEDTAILMYTGSIVSVFKNKKMLTDVEKVPMMMRALTNGGHQDSSYYKWIFPGFFPVWFNEDSRVNILAWKDIRKKSHIAADINQ